MTFQAYLDSIKAKTGKGPEDFKSAMIKAKVFKPDLTATDFCNWLAAEYDLGHGHAMALWAVFKSKGWVAGPKKK